MALDQSVSPHTGVRATQNTGVFWQAVFQPPRPYSLFFGKRLRRQNFNLVPTQYRRPRRLWNFRISVSLIWPHSGCKVIFLTEHKHLSISLYHGYRLNLWKNPLGRWTPYCFTSLTHQHFTYHLPFKGCLASKLKKRLGKASKSIWDSWNQPISIYLYLVMGCDANLDLEILNRWISNWPILQSYKNLSVHQTRSVFQTDPVLRDYVKILSVINLVKCFWKLISWFL